MPPFPPIYPTPSITGPGSDYSRYVASHPEAKLIGVDGRWFDIGKFAERHPGGFEVISRFVGKDATAPFKAFHERDVLKGWRPIGYFEAPAGEELQCVKAFEELGEFFRREGFFKTSYLWYTGKVILTFALLGVAIWLMKAAQGRTMVLILGGLVLGLFWQQCGFFMHDFMHNELTHKCRVDQTLGMFFGTVCFGISSHWWRDEHFEHHAFTNSIDVRSGYFDPQMREDVWAQSPELFALLLRGGWLKSVVETLLVRTQHWLLCPLCVGVGRIGIMVDSMLRERRWYEWMSFCLHWLWISSLLLWVAPRWRDRVLIYTAAAIFEGVLHIQLVVSHYAKPWTPIASLCDSTAWSKMQVYCNINIANPVYLDWFHGGLNFHIEHHLYPTMPRHNFRAASKHVKRVCKELGLHYDECCWSQAIIRTIQHFKKTAATFCPAEAARQREKLLEPMPWTPEEVKSEYSERKSFDLSPSTAAGSDSPLSTTEGFTPTHREKVE